MAIDQSPNGIGIYTQSLSHTHIIIINTQILLCVRKALSPYFSVYVKCFFFQQGFFMSIFNSIYAFFMFVVVVFFLIYGVEVYFKVRGAFAPDRETESSESISADISQLQQSRLGLFSQAVLLLVTLVIVNQLQLQT